MVNILLVRTSFLETEIYGWHGPEKYLIQLLTLQMGNLKLDEFEGRQKIVFVWIKAPKLIEKK